MLTDDAYFDREDRPEVALWRAVIAQAIWDARGIGLPLNNRAMVQAEALAWFDTERSDFRRVCMFADVDPVAVAERAQEIFAGPEAGPSHRRKQDAPHAG